MNTLRELFEKNLMYSDLAKRGFTLNKIIDLDLNEQAEQFIDEVYDILRRTCDDIDFMQFENNEHDSLR